MGVLEGTGANGVSERAGIEAAQMAERSDGGGAGGSGPGFGTEAAPEECFECARATSESHRGTLDDARVGWLDAHGAEVVADRRGSSTEGQSANVGGIAERSGPFDVRLCGIDPGLRLAEGRRSLPARS